MSLLVTNAPIGGYLQTNKSSSKYLRMDNAHSITKGVIHLLKEFIQRLH